MNGYQIIKKHICIIISFICLLCSAAEADSHISICGRFNRTVTEQVFTLDIYEQQGTETLVSTLLPDTALLVNESESISVMSLIHSLIFICPENLSLFLKETEQLLAAWIIKQEPAISTGVFTGDLFDYATLENSCEFHLSSFIKYSEAYLQSRMKDSESNRVLYSQISDMIQFINSEINGSDPLIRYRSFDHGKYISFMVMNQGNVNLVFSADCSAQTEKHIIVSSKEREHYYFREYLIYSEPDSCNVSFSLRRGQKTTYRSEKKLHPIISEKTQIKRMNDSQCSFSCTFEAAELNNPMIITGFINRESDSSGTIEAGVSLQSTDPDLLHISLCTEPICRNVSFDDKTIKSIHKKTDIDEIHISLMSTLTTLLSEIYPMLPSDYQTMVYQRLFQ